MAKPVDDQIGNEGYRYSVSYEKIRGWGKEAWGSAPHAPVFLPSIMRMIKAALPEMPGSAPVL